jgi:hypothetical protein
MIYARDALIPELERLVGDGRMYSRQAAYGDASALIDVLRAAAGADAFIVTSDGVLSAGPPEETEQ